MPTLKQKILKVVEQKKAVYEIKFFTSELTNYSKRPLK